MDLTTEEKRLQTPPPPFLKATLPTKRPLLRQPLVKLALTFTKTLKDGSDFEVELINKHTRDNPTRVQSPQSPTASVSGTASGGHQGDT